MLSILELNQPQLVIQSFSFNDHYSDRVNDGNLTVSTQIQINKKYYSIDLKKIRIDCNIYYTGLLKNEEIAFTLNASVRVIFNVKNGVNEEELHAIINNNSDENLKRFNLLVTPVIQKGIQTFLVNTDYSI